MSALNGEHFLHKKITELFSSPAIALSSGIFMQTALDGRVIFSPQQWQSLNSGLPQTTRLYRLSDNFFVVTVRAPCTFLDLLVVLFIVMILLTGARLQRREMVQSILLGCAKQQNLPASICRSCGFFIWLSIRRYG